MAIRMQGDKLVETDVRGRIGHSGRPWHSQPVPAGGKGLLPFVCAPAQAVTIPPGHHPTGRTLRYASQGYHRRDRRPTFRSALSRLVNSAPRTLL